MKSTPFWKFGILFLIFAVLLAWTFSDTNRKNVNASEKRPVIQAVDFKSLQDALNALPENGGIVELEAKTYEITQPLLLKTGDVLIRGKGTASHIKNLNATGKPALILASGIPNPKRKERQTSLWRIQLSDFRITGNEKSGHGIQADFINELYLDSMSINYNGGDGIHCHFCFEDARINDCLFTYNKKSGVYAIGNHDTIISATQFEENYDAVTFIDGFNLTATGNNIDDHLRHGFVINNSMGSTISSNMIEQCEGAGIVLENNTYATTVGANIFTADKKGGVILRDVHGSTITGNTFTIQPINAVAIDSKCRAITVTGNTFANRNIGESMFKGKPSDNIASGIVLENTMLHTITGNTFSNLNRKAIELVGTPSQKILFSNNLIINSESDHKKLLQSEVHGNLIHKETYKSYSQKVTLPKKEKLHIYLLIGQSNMAGRGVMTDNDRKPVAGILSLNKHYHWQQARHPLHQDRPKIPGVGMGISFAKEMQKQNPGVTIGVIPCAVGGTPLSRWGKEGDLYKAALTRAKIALKNGELKGIIWHQGESDSGDKKRASSYAARLKKAIKSWRADLNAPDVPFIVGEIGHFWVEKEPETKLRSLINQQLNSIPTLVPNTACISAKDLKAKPDGIHFNRAALIEFGKRYAKKMIELQKKTK